MKVIAFKVGDRQLTSPSQQKNVRSQVANVLKQYHPQHRGIAHHYVLLSIVVPFSPSHLRPLQPALYRVYRFDSERSPDNRKRSREKPQEIALRKEQLFLNTPVSSRDYHQRRF